MKTAVAASDGELVKVGEKCPLQTGDRASGVRRSSAIASFAVDAAAASWFYLMVVICCCC